MKTLFILSEVETNFVTQIQIILKILEWRFRTSVSVVESHISLLFIFSFYIFFFMFLVEFYCI